MAELKQSTKTFVSQCYYQYSGVLQIFSKHVSILFREKILLLLRFAEQFDSLLFQAHFRSTCFIFFRPIYPIYLSVRSANVENLSQAFLHARNFLEKQALNKQTYNIKIDLFLIALLSLHRDNSFNYSTNVKSSSVARFI